jgi:hypothetical protein
MEMINKSKELVVIKIMMINNFITSQTYQAS